MNLFKLGGFETFCMDLLPGGGVGRGGETTRQIDLGEDFGKVVVEVNGVSIAVDADGKVEVHESADVKRQREREDRIRIGQSPDYGDLLPHR